jgi:cytochrome bd-type quinol oxidase subunit 2
MDDPAMSTTVIWIVFALVSLAASQIARRDPEGARKASRLLPLVLAVMLGTMAATGWLHSEDTASKIHHWMADTIVLALWISVAFSSGTLMQREIRRRPLVAMSQLFAFLFAFGLLSSNAVTGYIDPKIVSSDDAQAAAQAFHVLHQYFFPVLIFAMLAEWWWFFGPPKESSQM